MIIEKSKIVLKSSIKDSKNVKSILSYAGIIKGVKRQKVMQEWKNLRNLG